MKLTENNCFGLCTDGAQTMSGRNA